MVVLGVAEEGESPKKITNYWCLLHFYFSGHQSFFSQKNVEKQQKIKKSSSLIKRIMSKRSEIFRFFGNFANKKEKEKRIDDGKWNRRAQSTPTGMSG